MAGRTDGRTRYMPLAQPSTPRRAYVHVSRRWRCKWAAFVHRAYALTSAPFDAVVHRSQTFSIACRANCRLHSEPGRLARTPVASWHRPGKRVHIGNLVIITHARETRQSRKHRWYEWSGWIRPRKPVRHRWWIDALCSIGWSSSIHSDWPTVLVSLLQSRYGDSSHVARLTGLVHSEEQKTRAFRTCSHFRRIYIFAGSPGCNLGIHEHESAQKLRPRRKRKRISPCA